MSKIIDQSILYHFAKAYPNHPWKKIPWDFKVIAETNLDASPRISLLMKWSRRDEWKNFVLYLEPREEVRK